MGASSSSSTAASQSSNYKSNSQDIKKQSLKMPINEKQQQGQNIKIISASPPQDAPKLKGILKNKDYVRNDVIQKPVKIVELYIQKGDQWIVLRVREDEAEAKKRELKSDKTVKRIYVKPVHDTTFLHFKAI